MTPVQYEPAKVLSAPQLPGKLGEPKIIRIVTAIKPNDYKKEGREKPNDSCLVNDMESDNTDRQYVLTVPTIMKNELEKTFKNESYVGQVFQLTRWSKPQGGKASPVELIHMKVKK